MTIILGVDVSKQNLDVFDTHFQKHKVFSNTLEGIQQLIKTYQNFELKKAIIESTGVYQRLAHKTLEQAGFEVCIVNPYKSRCFAKSAGFLAKTDKVDAKMLSSFGQTLDIKSTPYPSHNKEELDSLIVYKSRLEEEKQRQINQLEYDHASVFIQTLIKQRLSHLTQDIKAIQKQIDILIQEDNDFRSKKEILESVPGVGATTVATMLCYLPELGQINRKQIAALVGLAPMVCDSGQFRGRAMIKGGRANVRKSLYMPILACIRSNPPITAFYKRLRKEGKPAKVAIVACMRKLLIILNVMLKNNQHWVQKIA